MSYGAKKIVFLAAAVVAAGAMSSQASAAPFTPNDLVVMKVSQTGLSESTSLVEYQVGSNPASAVQTINLPTTGVNAFSSTTALDANEHVHLSTNGQYLTLAGYNTDVGQDFSAYNPAAGGVGLAGTPASLVTRTVALVKFDGTITYNPLPGAYDQVQINGAITMDGTQLWTAGENNKVSLTDDSGGPRYTVVGSSSSVCLYTPADNGTTGTSSTRDINIAKNQLYISTGSSSYGGTGNYKGVWALGSGLSTPAADSKLGITKVDPPKDSATTFCFLDANHDGVMDTLYLAAGGILKYELIRGTWTLKGTIPSYNGSDINELAARMLPDGTAELYTLALNPNGTEDDIYRYVDAAPLTDSISGNLATMTPYIRPDPSGDYAFGGFDFAPVPEPASLGLLFLGTLVLFARRCKIRG